MKKVKCIHESCWIEISKETFENCFEKIKPVDAVIKYTTIALIKNCLERALGKSVS